MKVKLNGNDFYEVTCPFGSTDPLHPYGHTGIDLAISEGTKLFSPVDGVIKKIVDYGNENLGKSIFIETEDNKTVILGHLSKFGNVSEGDVIHKGDLVALTGNTGRSTGSHLHLGLKDESGEFIDPDTLLNENTTTAWDKFIERGKIDNYQSEVLSDKNFMDFINDWRQDGFFMAMYDKPFFEVVKDFTSQLAHDVGLFILGNGDLIFLLPAILFMFGTFLIGKNKYTKFIIPLWFGYFVTSILHKLLLGG
ncbi:peptidase [Bacillus phage vB_BcoS-136]|uniref:Glycyl-glycine endopeptidase n=1 Tax=Bacillus phage vB_BcoS-136 TaxID=2419619 RepID=A0A3G3BVF1_9CAUD|nr:peptidase [Bacillus phage vB_BcoS-136]AYP68227.1 glycyl-glycine endopeptidase precursor [Bacillus phage vB_BcoS-136]